MTDERPDIAVVVMDCVRADVFDQAVRSGSMPFLASTEDKFLRFSRAIAPASWTIPSHASLFTGLYPWDHGAHYKGGAILAPGTPTLGEYLRDHGYRTACFSANGYVQPATGLTRGFDRAVWGGDREFFLRFLATEPSCPSLNGEDAAVHAILDAPSRASALRVGTMRTLSRFTPLCDAINRVGGHLRGQRPDFVGSWIERELAAEATAHADRPAFYFVNLLEAHEPYLADAGRPIGLGDWLSYARTTQVSEQWTSGERHPAPKDLAWSRRAYAASLASIDERLRRIVEVLRQRGRWDNTLFVVTSDHGQTFGEEGAMYHRLRLLEGITRIPLWVKMPSGGVGRPGACDAPWVGLTDVARTAVSLVDPSATFGDPSSVPLGLANESVGRTVYSMTDGLPKHEASRMPPARREELDRVQIAGYHGDLKTIVDQDGSQTFLTVLGDAVRPVPAGEGVDPAAFGEILPKVRHVLNLPEPATVSQRIAGWGY